MSVSKFKLTNSRAIVLLHLLNVTQAPTYYRMRNLIRGDLRGIIRSLIGARMVVSHLKRGEVYYRLTYRGYMLANAIDPQTLALKPGEVIPGEPDITDECRYNWKNLWVHQIIGSGARQSARKNAEKVRPISGSCHNRKPAVQKRDKTHKAA